MPVYRLKPEGANQLPAGTLLFPWQLGSHSTQPAGTIHLSESVNGQGRSLFVQRDHVEPIGDFGKGFVLPKWDEFERLAQFYMTGFEVPPNLQVGTDESLDADLNAIAHAYGAQFFSGRCKIANSGDPMASKWGEIAMAVMGRTQGGNLTGDAVVLRYKPSWGKPDAPFARTARFRLCAHDSVRGANARPERGWHPARCSRCGLDMTVDSSD